MTDLLKSVIQDLINDRTDQAQVAIHQYLVNKTQQVVGLTEAKGEPDKEKSWFKDKADWKKAVAAIDVDDDDQDSARYEGRLVAKWYPAREEGWVVSNKHANKMWR